MEFIAESADPWLNRGLVLIVVFIGLILFRKLCPNQKEYFSQTSPFVLRQDKDIYDSFYTDHYDDLHASEAYAEDDFQFIMETTSPDEKSVFLDIGCGTGFLLKRIEDNDLFAFGVDTSKSMQEKCLGRLKHTEVFCNDVLTEPMLYDNNTFTHITCTHFTIYEMEKKETLMRHCYNWLQAGGYFVVHLVDPDEYKKVLPSLNTEDNHHLSNVLNTNLEYNDYTYRGEYKSTKDTGYIFTETFTDKYTENVRQNQHRLYMESKQNVLDLAVKCGFVIRNETIYNNNIRDKHQYLVVLQKGGDSPYDPLFKVSAF